jgi:predicted nucleotidyltransferase
VERIVEVLHPEEIWLFGSRARGTHHPESDWDLMAVLPDDAPDSHLDIVQVWRRLKDLRLQRVEIFPVRRRDFEEGRHLLGTLSQIVTTEGRAIYG